MSTLARRLRRVVPLPNIRLRLVPPTSADAVKGLDEVVFITTPDVTKTEIKSFLETVCGVSVRDVRTANYEGKKKRDKGGFHRKPDYKKAYVSLTERWFPPAVFRVKPASGTSETTRGASGASA